MIIILSQQSKPQNSSIILDYIDTLMFNHIVYMAIISDFVTNCYPSIP